MLLQSLGAQSVLQTLTFFLGAYSFLQTPTSHGPAVFFIPVHFGQCVLTVAVAAAASPKFPDSHGKKASKPQIPRHLHLIAATQDQVKQKNLTKKT